MTTTPTKPNPVPPNPWQVREPEPDPARLREARVQRKMRRFRPLMSTIAAAMIVGGAYYLAICLGRNTSIVLAGVIVVAGLAMVVGAQVPGFYGWMVWPVKAPAAAGPAVVPRQRQPADAPTLPTVKPDIELGVEFGYLVLYARSLALHDRQDVFVQMSAFWDQFDWETADEDVDDFRDLVEFLADLVAKLPGYSEEVTGDRLRAQLMDGSVDPHNPYPFLAELFEYHPFISAMGALMLVRTDDEVTADDEAMFLNEWRRMRLWYRIENTIFKVDKDGQYVTVPARTAAGRRRGNPGRAAQAADQVPAGTLDDVLAAAADKRAAAAPPPPAPAPTPTPAPARVVNEPSPGDDVPDPTPQNVLEAAELIIIGQSANAATISITLRIGRALTMKLLHRLHTVYNLVGPYRDGVDRDVLVPTDQLDDMLAFIREEEATRQHNK